MAGTRISVRIDPDLQVCLNAEAEATGKKQSEIVREALQDRLKPHHRKPTPYELLLKSGLIGAIKGGPPDLSTNKKYFEGFGESRNANSGRYRAARRRTAKR